MPKPSAPVLLFDGQCPLCNGLVRRLLAHDRRGRLRFAPLGGETAARVGARHPELARVDSVVLVTGLGTAYETVQTRSAAGLAVLRLLGGPWRLLLILRLLPRAWRDGLYDWVARHRAAWFGRRDECPLPGPEDRSRFLP